MGFPSTCSDPPLALGFFCGEKLAKSCMEHRPVTEHASQWRAASCVIKSLWGPCSHRAITHRSSEGWNGMLKALFSICIECNNAPKLNHPAPPHGTPPLRASRQEHRDRGLHLAGETFTCQGA